MKRVTKRGGYREAVQWIALNDNAGNGDNCAAVAEYISVALVADLFGAHASRVAEDVMKIRMPHKYP